MKIQVLGGGCPSCKKLFDLTKRAVEQLNLETEVEYIIDFEQIVKLGVMQSPVLAVNDRPVMVGLVPDLEKIKEVIKNNI